MDELEVDACLVATGRAPYTNGLNLGAVGVTTDRRGFIPVSDKMEVRWGGVGRSLVERAVPRGKLQLLVSEPHSPQPAALSQRRPLPPHPQVLDSAGKVVPHLYCIGDANGKYMLAHAASAQVRSRLDDGCSL